MLNDLPKFKGVEDPKDHLHAFTLSMSLKGMGKELFASVFPLTLDTHHAKWFKSLNKVKVDDWDYIKEEFLKQYCYNSQFLSVFVNLRQQNRTNMKTLSPSLLDGGKKLPK